MQHDYEITRADANTGIAMRAAINAALQALATNNGGAPEPATPYATMWWPDTANDQLKIRNAGNTAWITVGKLSEAGFGLTAKALYTAHSILSATTAGTPAALTVTEDSLVGRLAGGGIAALSVSQVKTLLAIASDIAAALDIAADYADNKVSANAAITPGTATKITYDAKGLVTAGAAATQDDIGDGTTYKQYSATEKSKLVGIEAAADVTDAANVGVAIHGVDVKTTLVDDDEFGFINSVGNVLNKITWVNLKSTLLTSPTITTPNIDVINEATADHGVIIDGVTMKDGGVSASRTVDPSAYAAGSISDQMAVNTSILTTLNGSATVNTTYTYHTPLKNRVVIDDPTADWSKLVVCPLENEILKTSPNSIGSLCGAQSYVTNTGAGTLSSIYGQRAYAYHKGAGTISYLYGLGFIAALNPATAETSTSTNIIGIDATIAASASVSGSTAVSTTMYGMSIGASASASAGGTATVATIIGESILAYAYATGAGAVSSVTNLYGLKVSTGAKQASSGVATITNCYSIYVVNGYSDNTGTVTNAYGLYIEAITHGGTLNYAIYSAGGLNHFIGNVNTQDVYKVDKIQVVGNRVIDARCDDTINESSWDSTTAGVLDSIRDAMITHGLLAAA